MVGLVTLMNCQIEQAITAIEERIIALEARVSLLASSLVRLDMRLSQVSKEIPQPPPEPEIDLNAEVPEGSTILMESEAAGNGAANYRLQTIRGMIMPLPPEMLCNTPCFCTYQVFSADYGNTCSKSALTCPFNKAFK